MEVLLHIPVQLYDHVPSSSMKLFISLSLLPSMIGCSIYYSQKESWNQLQDTISPFTLEYDEGAFKGSQ